MHHTDLYFDVTTGLRFHPLEIVISMLIKIGVVLAIGASATAVLAFEVLLNATSMFNHGDVGIPEATDRWLRWILVTPDMHRVHHSIVRVETNSNFGFNLPWWDHLMRTYRAQPAAGHFGMTIGIDQFRSSEDWNKGGGHAFYTHLYAAQGFYMAGDEYWDAYFPKARDQLLAMQQPDGSWNGDGIGQVYGTAIAAIILQLPFKYLPVFQR